MEYSASFKKINKIIFCILMISITVVIIIGLYKEFKSELIDTNTYGVVCYVSKTGECYHSDTCQYYKDSYKETTVSLAIKEGYRACSKCRPTEQGYVTIVSKLSDSQVAWRTIIRIPLCIIVSLMFSGVLYSFILLINAGIYEVICFFKKRIKRKL